MNIVTILFIVSLKIPSQLGTLVRRRINVKDSDCSDDFSSNWSGDEEENSSGQTHAISCLLESQDSPILFKPFDIDAMRDRWKPTWLSLRCKSNCYLDFEFDGITPQILAQVEPECRSWRTNVCITYGLDISILVNTEFGFLSWSSGKYRVFCKRNPTVQRSLYMLLQDNEEQPSILQSGISVELFIPQNETNIIVPCRSTLWNTRVFLTRLNPPRPWNLISTFDPTIGYNLTNEHYNLLGNYICNDKRNRSVEASLTFKIRSSDAIKSQLQGQAELDKNGTVTCRGTSQSKWIVTIVYAQSRGEAQLLKPCINHAFECSDLREICKYIPGQCQVKGDSGFLICKEKGKLIASHTIEFVKGVDKNYYTLNKEMSMPMEGRINMTLTEHSHSLHDSVKFIQNNATIFPGKYIVFCHFAEYIYTKTDRSVRLYSNELGTLMQETIPFPSEDVKSMSVHLKPNYTGLSCVTVRRDSLSEEMKTIEFNVVEPNLLPSSMISGFIALLGMGVGISLLILWRIILLRRKYIQTSKEILEFKYGKPVGRDSVKTSTADNVEIELNEIARTTNSITEHKNVNDMVVHCTSNDHDCDPYDRSYEIRDFTMCENELGSGRYGIVKEGIVNGQKVAVKTCRLPVDKMCLESLKSELKLLIFIQNEKDNEGKNILKLIGANTKKLRTGELYIFLQFCELGNLAKYLWNYSNPNTPDELSDIQVGNYYMTTKSKKSLAYRKLALWSFQIANGMEYLASKTVIHIDLAARNILLHDEDTINICDFGLSRKLIQSIYVKEKSECLPIQWLAPESLNKENLTFSTKTDVWSYGVTLWEIYSLAAQEPNLVQDWDSLRAALVCGTRLDQPKYANLEIYSTMLDCWSLNPKLRPTFTELKRFFENVMYKTPDTLELPELTIPDSDN